MFGHHLTLATRNREAVFVDEQIRSETLHRIARIAGPHLWAFCVVDDHLHLAVLLARVPAGRLCQALICSLQWLFEPALGPGHIEPILTRGHARRVVDYELVQPVRHGLSEHPALWTGSCFQELARTREIGISLRLREVLPRYTLRDALRAVGLPALPIAPVSDEQLRELALPRLLAGAADAVAAGRALRGKGGPQVRARRVAIHLAERAGFSSASQARALDVTDRTVRRLLSVPADDRTVRAARMRLGLELSVEAMGWQPGR